MLDARINEKALLTSPLEDYGGYKGGYQVIDRIHCITPLIVL